MNDPVDPRVRAASLLRELGHAFAAQDPDEATLEMMSRTIGDLIASLEHAPERVRTWRREPDRSGPLRDRIPPFGSGASGPMASDSLVTGGANPMGLGAHLSRDGDQAVMRVTLGRSFEGAHGRAHGGILAALMDETMGMAVAMTGEIALTGRLSITYRGPAPIETEVVSRAWIEGRDGRKITVTGRITAGEATVLEAEGLFIAVDVDKVIATA